MEKPGLKTLPAEISDKEYTEGVYETARAFVGEGKDLILVKRAGCVTLKTDPSVVHLGLFSTWNHRVVRVAQRLGSGVSDAEDIVAGLERARAAWFRKIADVDPTDPGLYTLTFETGGALSDDQIAQRVVDSAMDIRSSQGDAQLIAPHRTGSSYAHRHDCSLGVIQHV